MNKVFFSLGSSAYLSPSLKGGGKRNLPEKLLVQGFLWLLLFLKEEENILGEIFDPLKPLELLL